MELRDIQLNIPAEYADDFLKIIGVGLQRVKLSQEAKKNLQAWWDVEQTFIQEEINEQSSNKGISLD